ncbi:hypothetical protein [Halochromatium roseum]|uniref:hypothetical protein n=1 Tax=Halochromatium roseum TaxID=391920 RepID=UPI001F5C648D|nr:hypothetical protein [Halochromatium roseum]
MRLRLKPKAAERWVQAMNPLGDAPPREILEVRNALAAYDRFPSWRPEMEADLLDAHCILIAGLIDEAGVYRRGGVGVMADDEVIHLAPPAARVPGLTAELLR